MVAPWKRYEPQTELRDNDSRFQLAHTARTVTSFAVSYCCVRPSGRKLLRVGCCYSYHARLYMPRQVHRMQTAGSTRKGWSFVVNPEAKVGHDQNTSCRTTIAPSIIDGADLSMRKISLVKWNSVQHLVEVFLGGVVQYSIPCSHGVDQILHLRRSWEIGGNIVQRDRLLTMAAFTNLNLK